MSQVRQGSRGRATGLVRAALAAAALAASAPAAAPYVPESDDVVLERVGGPQDPELRRLAHAKRNVLDNPSELEPALTFARSAIELGRQRSDPRLMGQAEAALAPFVRVPEPALETRVLQATLLQNRHEFSLALNMLEPVFAQAPHHPQAWLTRAVIELVQGDPSASRASCTHLFGRVDALVAITCVGQASARAGRSRESYDAMRRALDGASEAPVSERKWSLIELGEIAARRGDSRAAEEHLRAALALDSDDAGTRVALADFLLDERRFAEARALIDAATPSDGALLRRALAQRALDDPDWQASARDLEARFAEARLRGAALHEREEARFALHLRDDPARAAELARANFATQREPADARILLEAALAARDRTSAQPALEWLAHTQLEDVRLAVLAAELAAIE